MQTPEDEVRQLMVLQSQVNVAYLDLCLSGHLKQLKELNLVYEDISGYLIRRIDSGEAPFDVFELIKKRLIDIFGQKYVDSLWERVQKSINTRKSVN